MEEIVRAHMKLDKSLDAFRHLVSLIPDDDDWCTLLNVIRSDIDDKQIALLKEITKTTECN